MFTIKLMLQNLLYIYLSMFVTQFHTRPYHCSAIPLIKDLKKKKIKYPTKEKQNASNQQHDFAKT